MGSMYTCAYCCCPPCDEYTVQTIRYTRESVILVCLSRCLILLQMPALLLPLCTLQLCLPMNLDFAAVMHTLPTAPVCTPFCMSTGACHSLCLIKHCVEECTCVADDSECWSEESQ